MTLPIQDCRQNKESQHLDSSFNCKRATRVLVENRGPAMTMEAMEHASKNVSQCLKEKPIRE
ncbi:conserved hypothetical protein [Ricinus communis]|uniref:Uncharacterized protein n=1 Tax=Ricinus communis TaxID=3988 RepID=B9SVP9_RICCO|nr:conserved hypothetical protein [Ricinus communis]